MGEPSTIQPIVLGLSSESGLTISEFIEALYAPAEYEKATAVKKPRKTQRRPYKSKPYETESAGLTFEIYTPETALAGTLPSQNGLSDAQPFVPTPPSIPHLVHFSPSPSDGSDPHSSTATGMRGESQGEEQASIQVSVTSLAEVLAVRTRSQRTSASDLPFASQPAARKCSTCPSRSPGKNCRTWCRSKFVVEAPICKSCYNYEYRHGRARSPGLDSSSSEPLLTPQSAIKQSSYEQHDCIPDPHFPSADEMRRRTQEADEPGSTGNRLEVGTDMDPGPAAGTRSHSTSRKVQQCSRCQKKSPGKGSKRRYSELGTRGKLCGTCYSGERGLDSSRSLLALQSTSRYARQCSECKSTHPGSSGDWLTGSEFGTRHKQTLCRSCYNREYRRYRRARRSKK
ncbi:hypothetical protein DFH09DRAFT_226798 [Mycena vulgaris]|nr:hypothetical protein DFH09DRAFT_568388 [Mycena vulgaris]KAJ6520821.1 hypothetical protein DFH09DRAFT_226798 [Mycena vulgaris]